MSKEKFFLVLAVFALAAAAFGQSGENGGTPDSALPLATETCQNTYTSGSGHTFMQFCVTVNGNIVEFQSPSGVENIREGSFNEGYGICDFNTLTRYFDWAYADSGNWLPPTTTQPGGPNTFPLTIKRITSDGVFTLTQVFSRNTGERFAKVVMTLKNNTILSKSYSLIRYADVDANNANGGTFQNEFDFDWDSAWGYNSGFNSHGLMLTTSTPQITHFAFVQNVAPGPDPCSPVAHLPATPFFGDGSVGLDWNGTLGPSKAVTAAGEYRAF